MCERKKFGPPNAAYLLIHSRLRRQILKICSLNKTLGEPTTAEKKSVEFLHLYIN